MKNTNKIHFWSSNLGGSISLRERRVVFGAVEGQKGFIEKFKKVNAERSDKSSELFALRKKSEDLKKSHPTFMEGFDTKVGRKMSKLITKLLETKKSVNGTDNLNVRIQAHKEALKEVKQAVAKSNLKIELKIVGTNKEELTKEAIEMLNQSNEMIDRAKVTIEGALNDLAGLGDEIKKVKEQTDPEKKRQAIDQLKNKIKVVKQKIASVKLAITEVKKKTTEAVGLFGGMQKFLAAILQFFDKGERDKFARNYQSFEGSADQALNLVGQAEQDIASAAKNVGGAGRNEDITENIRNRNIDTFHVSNDETISGSGDEYDKEQILEQFDRLFTGAEGSDLRADFEAFFEAEGYDKCNELLDDQDNEAKYKTMKAFTDWLLQRAGDQVAGARESLEKVPPALDKMQDANKEMRKTFVQVKNRLAEMQEELVVKESTKERETMNIMLNGPNITITSSEYQGLEKYTVVSGDTLGEIIRGNKKTDTSPKIKTPAGVKVTWGTEVEYLYGEGRFTPIELRKAGKIWPGNKISFEGDKIIVELNTESQKQSIARGTEFSIIKEKTSGMEVSDRFQKVLSRGVKSNFEKRLTLEEQQSVLQATEVDSFPSIIGVDTEADRLIALGQLLKVETAVNAVLGEAADLPAEEKIPEGDLLTENVQEETAEVDQPSETELKSLQAAVVFTNMPDNFEGGKKVWLKACKATIEKFQKNYPDQAVSSADGRSFDLGSVLAEIDQALTAS